MRKIITEKTVYNFDELPANIKDKAIEKLWDINVDYEWWETIYMDAEMVGIGITKIDRNRHCKGEFVLSANEVAQNIINNHGEMCETYKTASSFMAEWAPIFADYMDENSESYESEDKLQDIEDEFLKSILEDYSIMLQREYEYLTSYEAIKETIVCNKYEFDAEGNLS